MDIVITYFSWIRLAHLLIYIWLAVYGPAILSGFFRSIFCDRLFGVGWIQSITCLAVLAELLLDGVITLGG